ncbi:sporulation protein YpjB [Gorillibacterium massiliense]|uniref:sporulation protein YpjB n=1 Tax=Gorillibacterium massiliense TaxID=1280390 RepID=UPI0004B9778D|nr:sporulation protein YpjB [Gorillibacterium massiliense]
MFWMRNRIKKGYASKVLAAIALLFLLSAVVAISGCSSRETRVPPGSVAVAGEDVEKITALDKTASDLYRLIQSGSMAEAREKAKQLGSMATGTEFRGFTGIEGMKVLSDAILAVNRQLYAVQIFPDRALAAARTVKLITDAMAHPEEPMWRQYIRPALDRISALRLAAEGNKPGEAAAILTDLYNRYDVFRSAVLVKGDPSEVEKIDSLFAFLKKQTGTGKFDSAYTAALKELVSSFNALSGESKDRPAYLPLPYQDKPFYWPLTIGGVLLFTLGYVGWRMLRSGKNIAPLRMKTKRADEKREVR